MTELFNVVQFFPDGHYEYLRGGTDYYGDYHAPVPAEEAVTFAKELTERPAAKLGIIAKVMIEDSGGSCVFLWERGKVVFPTREECEAVR